MVHEPLRDVAEDPRAQAGRVARLGEAADLVVQLGEDTDVLGVMDRIGRKESAAHCVVFAAEVRGRVVAKGREARRHGCEVPAPGLEGVERVRELVQEPPLLPVVGVDEVERHLRNRVEVDERHGRLPAASRAADPVLSGPGRPVHPAPVESPAMKRALLLSLAAAALLAATPVSQAEGPKPAPYVVEYYYKAKWGYADEFARLFRKNHLPVLKKQVESGRFLDVKAEKPRYHATEDGRWDYRVTIVFRSAADAADSSGEDAIKKRLFPDQDAYGREEQRRFDILLAHWDVPVTPAPEMVPVP